MTRGRALASVLALVLAGSSATTARAHGVFPEVERVALGASGAIAVQTSFGLASSRDGGASWGWICRDAFGALETEDPPLAIATDGALLVPLFVGLRRGERLGCGWSSPAGPLSDRVVIDLDRDPSGPDGFVAVTSAGGTANGLFRTTDGGRTWAPTGPAVEGVLFESVRVAPSDPSRIYLAGATPGVARDAFVYRSDDGGATFLAQPFALPAGARNVRLVAVDPADPARLFARIVGPAPALVVSDDGGASFAPVPIEGDGRAVAFGEGGAIVVAGPAPLGLVRSDDGGATFRRLPAVSDARCVVVRGRETWVCANDVLDGFALGVSTDGGETFEPALRLAQIERRLVCASDDATSLACAPEEATLRAVLAPTRARAAGCAVGLSPSSRAPRIALVAGVVLLVARRRSRARGASVGGPWQGPRR